VVGQWTSHGSSECAPPPLWSLFRGPSLALLMVPPSVALLMVPPSVALHYGPSIGLPRGPDPSLASPHGPSLALHGPSLAPPCPSFSCLSLLLPLLSSSTTYILLELKFILCFVKGYFEPFVWNSPTL
jgi:hypothetical protein